MGTDVDDSLKQEITIPANAQTADLVFWWYMESEEGTTTPTDWFYVRLRAGDGSLVAEWSKTNLSSRNVWQEETTSLLNYRGQRLYLVFEQRQRKADALVCGQGQAMDLRAVMQAIRDAESPFVASVSLGKRHHM